MARKKKPRLIKAGRPAQSGKRTPSGRLSRAGQTADQRADVLSVPMMARQRRLPPHLHDAALDPMAGCTAGRTLMQCVASISDRSDLWQAVCHIRRVYQTYDNAMGGLQRYAKVAAILVPVTAMETSADAPAYDDRTDADKSRQAVSAWMRVQGWFGMVSRHASSECIRLCIDMPEDTTARDSDGFIAALRVVACGLRGER